MLHNHMYGFFMFGIKFSAKANKFLVLHGLFLQYLQILSYEVINLNVHKITPKFCNGFHNLVNLTMGERNITVTTFGWCTFYCEEHEHLFVIRIFFINYFSVFSQLVFTFDCSPFVFDDNR
jgi:hypothetical protein